MLFSLSADDQALIIRVWKLTTIIWLRRHENTHSNTPNKQSINTESWLLHVSQKVIRLIIIVTGKLLISADWRQAAAIGVNWNWKVLIGSPSLLYFCFMLIRIELTQNKKRTKRGLYQSGFHRLHNQVYRRWPISFTTASPITKTFSKRHEWITSLVQCRWLLDACVELFCW